ncbi:MAG: serine hydrolase domain-containing protein, partial [Sphingomicrobium sp.]
MGAVALIVAAVVLAMQPGSSRSGDGRPAPDAQQVKLASLEPGERRDVDYAALDARLKQLIGKPGMVGLAVGVVEHGRITFLQGYGETHANSGDPVTPQTVFRWASVSKGVASTMAVKLAEEGKIRLNAPVATYVPSLKLPLGNERIATVGDLMSHRLGLYRNAYDNKLEEGGDPMVLRQSLVLLNSTCPPGTCWSYQNVAYDALSEMVERQTDEPYELALKRILFNPLGMSHASASMGGLMANKSWARPHGHSKNELPMVDTYYKVPAAGGVNSNITDMSLWMLAQMGEMPGVLDERLLKIIHAPYVKTPTERGRLRAYLER